MAEPSVNDLKALADARATDAEYLLAGGRHPLLTIWLDTQ
jgi:hypothetical protein